MNDEAKGTLDTIVQEKLESDSEFQQSIADLSEEEKEQAITSKKQEIIASEFENLSAQAKRAKELEEVANSYKIRAEKAERQKKEDKPAPQNKNNEGSLSTEDVFVLVQAGIHKDDVAEIQRISKVIGKSITETLDDPVTLSVLKTRKEQRTSAEAMNTQGKRSYSKKMTDAELLEKASRGDIPEQGSEEAERLFYARRGIKR